MSEVEDLNGCDRCMQRISIMLMCCLYHKKSVNCECDLII